MMNVYSFGALLAQALVAVAALLGVHPGPVPLEQPVPIRYHWYQTLPAEYGVDIPTGWRIRQSFQSKTAERSLGDGGLLEVSNVPWNEFGAGELMPVGSVILTITSFEKKPQETVAAALQKQGVFLGPQGLSPVPPVSGRPAFRVDSSHTEGLGVEATDIRYYIDDGDQLYYIGLAYVPPSNEPILLERFGHIVRSFRLLK